MEFFAFAEAYHNICFAAMDKQTLKAWESPYDSAIELTTTSKGQHATTKLGTSAVTSQKSSPSSSEGQYRRPKGGLTCGLFKQPQVADDSDSGTSTGRS